MRIVEVVVFIVHVIFALLLNKNITKYGQDKSFINNNLKKISSMEY